MRISVLALQGAFAEHRQMLRRLGVETFEVRRLSDWHQPKDALIIPGGESTVQLKLFRTFTSNPGCHHEWPPRIWHLRRLDIVGKAS